jgi:methionine-rich copper-binding protein CopC
VKRFKLQIIAGLLSVLGSFGIYLWPNSVVLIESDPSGQAREIEDNEIWMVFNRPVDVAKSSVTVTDPNGHVITTGLATKDLTDGFLLVVKTKSPYPPYAYVPGDYQVKWVVVVDNGKRGEGAFSFHMEDHAAHHGETHPFDRKVKKPHHH